MKYEVWICESDGKALLRREYDDMDCIHNLLDTLVDGGKYTTLSIVKEDE